MDHYIFLFVNTTLIVGCIILAVVFLTLPLPTNAGLNNYRISLRSLAAAYLVLALLKICIIYFDVAPVDLVSIVGITIAIFQALLFSITLINLINPQRVTAQFILKHAILLVGFIVVLIISSVLWGNPLLLNFTDLLNHISHPTVILRLIFLFIYIGELIYLTRIFSIDALNYKKKIDNFYAEKDHVSLPWVKYCFYSALLIGIGAILSCFILTLIWKLIFTISYMLFYFVFGLFYIQYPRSFNYIEHIIYTSTDIINTNNKYRRYDWVELRKQIVENEYFLKQGINIEDTALYLKIVRTTLSTYINQVEKMNFNTWINTLRVAAAKQLFIDHPEYKLTEISEMVGYSESSNFSRQFKQITNFSPSDWRQKHKEKLEK
jgi:AraC-like DNA-binding protein